LLNYVAVTGLPNYAQGFVDGVIARGVVARFDGGTVTSDAGAVPLRQTDRRLDLWPRLRLVLRTGASRG